MTMRQWNPRGQREQPRGSFWDEFLWNLLYRGTEPYRPWARATGLTPRTEAIMGTEQFGQAWERQRGQAAGLPEWLLPKLPQRPGAEEKEAGEKKQGWVFEKNFGGSGRDFMVSYMDGVPVQIQELEAGAGAGVQSLPIQARWQLQELARTRKALGVEPNPYWGGLEQSIQQRLEGGDITEEDIAMLGRARQAEILSRFQGIDVGGNQMAERLKQSRQWEADRQQLLAGLPSGPEGDVARHFVRNALSPWRELGAVSPGASTPQAMAESQKGPPAPAWLPEFVSGTTAGAPISGGTVIRGGAGNYPVYTIPGPEKFPFVPTPSGQQYTRMAPSQEKWLSGALEWYGGRMKGFRGAPQVTRTWADILDEMESMQPTTPTGAGKRKWKPPSQRVGV